MSGPAGRRKREQRVQTDFDIVLFNADGDVLDKHARATDMTVSGFQISTHSQLKEGETISFELTLDFGEKARGRGRLAWAAGDSRGSFTGGVKISKMSWRDARRLRGAIHEPGYNFVALAKMMFWAFYWITVAIGAHNLMNYHPLTMEVVTSLLPILAALLVAAWAVLTLLR